MTLPLSAIRAALVGAIASIPDVGVVHSRERYVRDEAKFRQLFVPAGVEPQQVRGWWVRRTGTSRRALNLANGVVLHEWAIRGYMALNDEQASELVFDDLVEAIATTVPQDPTLAPMCDPGPTPADDTNGIQVADAGPVLFCGVLCHSAVLSLKTWQFT